jgi:inactive STAND/Effector-associated domain 9
MLEKESIRMKANGLNKQIAALSEDHEKLIDQITRTNNDADRLRLKRNADSVFAEVEKLESELEKLNLSGGSYRQSWNHWDDHIHHIDYDDANKITDALLKKYERKEGVALFFLHSSQKMGGKWFLKSVKSKLKDLPLSQWTAPFECRLDSPPGGDSAVFLNRLSARFSLQVECKNEQEQIQKLIDKIYEALERSHVFLISITIDQVRSQDKFLEWFINHFWCVLVNKLSQVKEERPLIRIISVISVESKVANSQIPKDLCCSVKQFAPEKMIELPLKAWTKDQISTWLEAYSNLNPNEIPEQSESIHSGTENGIPSFVYERLMNKINVQAS